MIMLNIRYFFFFYKLLKIFARILKTSQTCFLFSLFGHVGYCHCSDIVADDVYGYIVRLLWFNLNPVSIKDYN